MSSSLDEPRDSPLHEPDNPLLRASNPLVSGLEQDVLDEYTRLLGNVNKVLYYNRLPMHTYTAQLKLTRGVFLLAM